MNVKDFEGSSIVPKVFIFAIAHCEVQLDNVILLHRLHYLLLNVTDFKNISPFFINNSTDSKLLVNRATAITAIFTLLLHHFRCTINHHHHLLLPHFHLNIFHHFHTHLLKTTELFTATEELSEITQLTTAIICYCCYDYLQLQAMDYLISTYGTNSNRNLDFYFSFLLNLKIDFFKQFQKLICTSSLPFNFFLFLFLSFSFKYFVLFCKCV